MDYFCQLRQRRGWRDGRAVECGGLENRCPAIVGPGVRIPLSPQRQITPAACCGIFVFGTFQTEFEKGTKIKIPDE